MAKITTKSYEELLVSEERAKKIQELIAEAHQNKTPLNMLPITLETNDKQLWCGSLADIGPITLNVNTTIKQPKYKFQSKEDLIRFHADYGYGGLKSEFRPGYGLVDIQTQFLIKSKQADIRDGQLVMLPMDKDSKEKWADLWQIYKQSLDEFQELPCN